MSVRSWYAEQPYADRVRGTICLVAVLIGCVVTVLYFNWIGFLLNCILAVSAIALCEFIIRKKQGKNV